MSFSEALGKHVLLEYHQCDAGILNDLPRLRELMLDCVRRSNAQIIKDVFHQFSPHGVTGVIVIAESHVAVHSWPEHQYAAVDIFSCSDRMSIETVVEGLRSGLGSLRVIQREVARGTSVERHSPTVELGGAGGIVAVGYQKNLDA